ncbi:hypothetical protein CEW46_21190 [Bacillus cereus]|nr:hypothetical protein CEW46_21190 [Bacillus cereus]
MAATTSNLLAEFLFSKNTTSSSWTSTSGSYTATLNNCTVLQDCISISQATSSINMPALPVPTTDYSLELYIRIPESASAGTIIGYQASSTNSLTSADVVYRSSKVVEFSRGGASPGGSSGVVAQNNTWVHLVVQVEFFTKRVHYYYNGVKTSSTTTIPGYVPWTAPFSIGGSFVANTSSVLRNLKMDIALFRVYDTMITAEQVAVNYADAQSLLNPVVPSAPPKLTEITVGTRKVSRILGRDISNVQFTFDQDISEFCIRLDGVSYDTGTRIASSTTPVAKGTTISFNIPSSAFISEGASRFNIYGKNSANQWTDYEQ